MKERKIDSCIFVQESRKTVIKSLLDWQVKPWRGAAQQEHRACTNRLLGMPCTGVVGFLIQAHSTYLSLKEKLKTCICTISCSPMTLMMRPSHLSAINAATKMSGQISSTDSCLILAHSMPAAVQARISFSTSNGLTLSNMLVVRNGSAEVCVTCV